jgi:hypothetical protein
VNTNRSPSTAPLLNAENAEQPVIGRVIKKSWFRREVLDVIDNSDAVKFLTEDVSREGATKLRTRTVDYGTASYEWVRDHMSNEKSPGASLLRGFGALLGGATGFVIQSIKMILGLCYYILRYGLEYGLNYGLKAIGLFLISPFMLYVYLPVRQGPWGGLALSLVLGALTVLAAPYIASGLAFIAMFGVLGKIAALILGVQFTIFSSGNIMNSTGSPTILSWLGQRGIDSLSWLNSNCITSFFTSVSQSSVGGWLIFDNLSNSITSYASLMFAPLRQAIHSLVNWINAKFDYKFISKPETISPVTPTETRNNPMHRGAPAAVPTATTAQSSAVTPSIEEKETKQETSSHLEPTSSQANTRRRFLSSDITNRPLPLYVNGLPTENLYIDDKDARAKYAVIRHPDTQKPIGFFPRATSAESTPPRARISMQTPSALRLFNNTEGSTVSTSSLSSSLSATHGSSGSSSSSPTSTSSSSGATSGSSGLSMVASSSSAPTMSTSS